MIATRWLFKGAAIATARRTFATAAGGSTAFKVFNRDAKRRQKDRAALDVEASRTVDYLRDEIAARVADRFAVRLR